MPEMDKGRRGAVGGHRLAWDENAVWRRCPRCRLPYAAPVIGQPNLRLCLFCGRRYAAPEWVVDDDLAVFLPTPAAPPAFGWLRDVPPSAEEATA